MYADLHCDTFYKCFSFSLPLNSDSLHITPAFLAEYVPCVQTFAHYIPENVRDKYTYFQEMLENTLEMVYSNSLLYLYKTGGDVLRAENECKILSVLSVENGNFFGDDKTENIRRADYLEKQGIKFLSLCYNNGSALCGGALNGGRLTKRGREVVGLLASRGISVDISHTNNASASDILSCNVKTAATHSNCYSLCKHPRNLTDENIYRLCESGGLIGVNLYSPFLTDTGRATLSDVKAHIERILSLGGKNSISLGADLDGCDSLPDGISDVRDIKKVYALTDGIQTLFYNNVKNYLLT